MPRDFIIIDPDPIVSMDLTELLSGHFPSGEVTSLHALDAVASVLNVITPDTTLFVRGSLLDESERLARVARAAAARGCYVVMIGASETCDLPGQVIEVPFSTEMVMAKLRAIVPTQPSHGVA